MAFGLASICSDAGASAAALIVGDQVVELGQFGETSDVLQLLNDWDAALPRLRAIASDFDPGRHATPLAAAGLVAPYRPRQIFCTGANYRKHVIGLIMGDPSMRQPGDEAQTEEDRRVKAEVMMDERAEVALPYCFIKLPSCVVGPTDAVVLPRNVVKPDWELELGVVIGKRARHVAPEAAMDYVAGFAAVNDITAREHIFRRDNSAIGADWLSGKCFPTFLPFGPMIVPRQFVPDPYALTITLSVNGRVFQNESTQDMMISIERQVAYLSDRVELTPGDVICTGSPYGNGSAFGVFLQPGDVMVGEITGLGVQRNRCVAET
jgi:2-keto-4-pentenoate hydratase/2-oxohepta-3-ene-1,7-dioic acid hydratase in catechol pathway